LHIGGARVGWWSGSVRASDGQSDKSQA
jgi:hypothetical protein